jgi:hypothetical protein
MLNPVTLLRNQTNGLKSTGPRSARGKAIAKRNSLRHGLCANPASAVVEDAGLFRKLHRSLVSEIGPTGVVEQALVHQIAICLWRLQRAAAIDAAVSDLSVANAATGRAEVQEWIGRINGAWRVERVEGHASDRVRRRKERGRRDSGGRDFRIVRPGLQTLDGFRERAMMCSGAALTAMAAMIEDLAQALHTRPGVFLPVEVEKLAWLLGESASLFPS